MSKKIPIYYSLPAILFSTFLVAIIVLAWTEPTAVPPGGNVPAPINVGNVDQWKDGRLGVGTAAKPIYWLMDDGESLAFQARLDGPPIQDVTRMIIGENGNVGIGTSNPGPNKLAVVGDDGASGIKIVGSIFGETASAGYIDYLISTGATRFFAQGVNATTRGTFKFFVRESDTGNTLVPIETQSNGDVILVQTSGNVGIGTPSPSTNLHVVGSMRVTGLASCNTIDTAVDGTLQCGIDETGAGAGKIYSAVGTTQLVAPPTASGWVNMTDMTISLPSTFSGGKVLIQFVAPVVHEAVVDEITQLYARLVIDGIAKVSNSVSAYRGTQVHNLNLLWVENLNAGSHTIIVQWSAGFMSAGWQAQGARVLTVMTGLQ